MFETEAVVYIVDDSGERIWAGTMDQCCRGLKHHVPDGMYFLVERDGEPGRRATLCFREGGWVYPLASIADWQWEHVAVHIEQAKSQLSEGLERAKNNASIREDQDQLRSVAAASSPPTHGSGRHAASDDVFQGLS